MPERATWKPHSRAGLTALLALAAFAFPVDASAEEILPALPQDVEAIVEQVETAAVEGAASLPVEVPPVDQPDIAAPEPITTPDAPEPDAPAAEPVEPASSPDSASPPAAEEPAAESVVVDTTQYQQSTAEPAEESPLPEPEPEPAQPEGAGTTPSEWTWIWNWDCSEPPDVPTSSSTSWTWIWNWECDAPDLSSDAIAVKVDEQYRAQSDRYQDATPDLIFSNNAHTSIRIFSPGDDGSVTQVNVASAASTSLTSTIVEETLRQARAALPPLPRLPAAPEIVPPLLEIRPSGLDAPAVPMVGTPWLDSSLLDVAPVSAPVTPLPAPATAAKPGPGRAALELRSHANPIDEPFAGSGVVPAFRAAPTLEPAAPSARRPAKQKPGRGTPPAPLRLAFPSGTATVGASAGGGAGAAFAAFLIALTLAYLVIPPGISYRVRLAEARAPRGVDLGGDDRPG